MAIVEAPQLALEPKALQLNEKKSDDDYTHLAAVSQHRPVTSSLRAATHRVYSIAGVLSFFRGLAPVICGIVLYALIAGSLLPVLNKVFMVTPPNPLTPNVPTTTRARIASELSETIANLLLGTILTAHTHILMTLPTLRVWYRRLPPFIKTLRSVGPCLLVGNIASLVTFQLPYHLLTKAGVYSQVAYLGPKAIGNALLLRRLVFVTVWLAAQVARLELVVPAGVATTHAQMSLLPADEDTIVPVRTYGSNSEEKSSGYMPRGILSPPQAAIGIRRAWKIYYAGQERQRILLVYAKLVAVEVAMTTAFWLLLGNEVWPKFWHPER